MTRPLLLALAAALAVVVAGCGPADANSSSGETAEGDSTGQYVVGGVFDDVSGRITTTVNGFPLGTRVPFMSRLASGTGIDTWATPALVSGRNVAAVEVVPYLVPGGARVRARPVRLRLWVEAPDGSVVEGTDVSAAAVDSLFEGWLVRLNREWVRWASASPDAAADSAWAWAGRHPFRVETAWVRPGGAAPSDGGPSFDAVFREAPVFGGTAADSARLRDYAVHLRDLVAAGDGAALYDEFAPAADDLADLHGLPPVPPDSLRALWAQDARDGGGWVGADPAPLAPSEVGLRSWSGGRVWELYRPGADGLLQGRDGGTYTEVFVGEVDGRLRVVRQ